MKKAIATVNVNYYGAFSGDPHYARDNSEEDRAGNFENRKKRGKYDYLRRRGFY